MVAPMLRVRMKGANALSRTLKQAGADMSKLKDANRSAAQVAQARASAITPRRSGKLQKTLRVTATQKAGVLRAGRKSVPYAGVINYGWPARHISARYYLNHAIKDTEPQWFSIYAKAIEQALNEIRGA